MKSIDRFITWFVEDGGMAYYILAVMVLIYLVVTSTAWSPPVNSP